MGAIGGHCLLLIGPTPTVLDYHGTFTWKPTFLVPCVTIVGSILHTALHAFAQLLQFDLLHAGFNIQIGGLDFAAPQTVTAYTPWLKSHTT